jgi:tetratricopeptide (TPR) repeat protein
MSKEPTICLNMIVKNESKIITRLFDSVLPIIDCYMICDTGSTDNTKEIIKSYFESKHIPGKIIYEPFKNFAYNRNVSLQNCVYMSDYVLLLDADMILDVRSFKKSDLINDSYFVLQGSEAFYYNNLRIVRNNGLYKYVGVTHEYIDTPPNSGIHNLDKTKLFILDVGDGGAKTNKYERDIQLLTKGIEEEPQNRERYYFYLANCYFDLGKYDEAIENYKMRITLNGFDQEVWYSYYRIGLSYKEQGHIEKAVYSWLEGYNFFPLRLENIYEIISHYRIIGKQVVSMQFYEMAKNIQKKIPDKDSYLFLSNDVYTYKLEYEYSIIACYVGITNINSQVLTILNNCDNSNITNNVLSNMKFYKDILKPSKIVKLNETIQHSIGGKTREFHSSSSCIVSTLSTARGTSSNILPSTRYLMNIRYVNYKITPSGSYLDCDDYIITINKYVEMTKDFQIIKEKMIDSIFDDRRYIGIEDVRIYYDKNNNLLLTGTGLNENNNLGIVIGNYSYDDVYIKGQEIKASFSQSDCEKNWVLTTISEKSNGMNEIKEDYIIYKWYPLLLCKMNENKTQIDVEIKKYMPKIFQHARGSTNASFYKNEIWFVVHYVSYEHPRHYYHSVVVFDNSMNLLRYSAPFKFEGEPIEYCIGLVVEEERLLITYSCWDNSTNIGIYDKKYIEEKLIEKI